MRNSPFAVFRRNQRELMVALTVLAMFAFVFLDSLNYQNGPVSPLTGAMVIALLFAGGLWAIGSRRGRGGEFALWGAVLGAVVGFFGFRAGSMGPVIRTSLVSFDRTELQNQMQRRSLANQFVSRAGPGRARMFGGTDDRSLVIRGLLLRDAKRMGISITDEGINQYLKTLVDDTLTTSQYEKMLRDLGISEATLYDVLREELEALTALRMSIPPRARQRDGSSGIETPLEYWKSFQRLEVKQQLSTVAVPVSQFLASVPEPKDNEIQQFFDLYKGKLPGADGTPGFLQERTVQLAYLAAEFESFEKLVPEPTDLEVEAYYNTNQDRYRVPLIPDSPAPTSEAPLLPDFESEEAPVSADQPSNVTPPALEAPASPDGSPAPASEGNAPAAADGTQPPAIEAPSAPETKKPETPQPDAPKPDPAASSTGTDGGDGELQVALADDAEAGDAAKEPSEAAEPPAAASPAQDAVAVDAEQKADPAAPQTPAEPASSPPVTDAAAPSAGSESSGSESLPPSPKPASKPLSPVLTPELPMLPDLPGSAPVATELRPLDDALRAEIRETMLRERTLARMADVVNRGLDEMTRLSNDYVLAETDAAKASVATKISETLKTYAKENGLIYRETKAMTQRELLTSTDEAIGAAMEPIGGEAGASRGNPVYLDAFSTDAVFFAKRVDAPRNDLRYAYWKIADNRPSVPELKTVRQAVVDAWKLEQARPLAAKRAEQLADLARKANAPMAESLAGQTLTGEPDSPAVAVRETPAFSWLSIPRNVPPFGLTPDALIPKLSTVDGVFEPGAEFMETVFEKIPNGGFGVALNQPRSEYYVVQVRNRQAGAAPGADELEWKAVQQNFMQAGRESLFNSMNPFRPDFSLNYALLSLSAEEQMALERRWQETFERQYAIEWPVSEESTGEMFE
jgi:hypothetical protein